MGLITSSCRRCVRPGFGEVFGELVSDMPISDSQKKFVNERYIREVEESENDYYRIIVAFFMCRFSISIASILGASLIMLSQSSLIAPTSKNAVLWVVWSLSLTTAIANEMIYAFKLDKKYLLDYSMLEKYYMEGWSFVAGINNYAITHDYSARFSIFCERLNLLQSKQLEEYVTLEGKQNMSDIIAAAANPKKVARADSLREVSSQ